MPVMVLFGRHQVSLMLFAILGCTVAKTAAFSSLYSNQLHHSLHQPRACPTATAKRSRAQGLPHLRAVADGASVHSLADVSLEAAGHIANALEQAQPAQVFLAEALNNFDGIIFVTGCAGVFAACSFAWVHFAASQSSTTSSSSTQKVEPSSAKGRALTEPDAVEDLPESELESESRLMLEKLLAAKSKLEELEKRKPQQMSASPREEVSLSKEESEDIAARIATIKRLAASQPATPASGLRSTPEAWRRSEATATPTKRGWRERVGSWVPKSAHVNAALLTAVTGGLVSTGVSRAFMGAGPLPLGRLDARDHVVVLSDAVDSKLMNVLKGMEHEAERRGSELRRAPVVVLTPQDRKAAQARIDAALAEEHGGRGPAIHVEARQGNPARMEDLATVNVQDARHVVWMKPEEEGGAEGAAGAAHAEQEAKLLSELRGGSGAEAEAVVVVSGREEGGKAGVGAERGAGFLQLEELALAEKMLQRVVAQPGSGLAHGLNELLAGGEVTPLHTEPISQACPWLMGKQYAEAQASFPSAMVCGLIRHDNVLLSPPADTWLSPFDRLVTISSGSEDSSPKRPLPTPSRPDLHTPVLARAPVGAAQHGAAPQQAAKPQKILLLNWNERGPTVLEQLRRAATEKGAVTVMADYNRFEDFGSIPGGVRGSAERSPVALYKGDTGDAAHLAQMKATGSDVIVVLPDADAHGHVDSSSDASLLATVQELSKLEWGREEGAPKTRVVGMVHSAEMEARMQAACEAAGLDSDLVLSERVEGDVATRVMLQPRMKEVVSAMVDKTRLVPVEEGFEGTFEELQQRADEQGLMVLGVAKGGSREVALKPSAKQWLSLTRSDSVLALPRLDADDLTRA